MGHCSMVTSKGANPNSWLLYLNTKARMEASAVEEKFEYTSIFRPGAINKEQNRSTIERILSKSFNSPWPGPSPPPPPPMLTNLLWLVGKNINQRRKKRLCPSTDS